MRHTSTRPLSRAGSLPLAVAVAFGLAACTGEPEDTTVETDVEDVGGGELIVSDADAPGVEVDLPETPMTPVPVEEGEAEGAAEDAAAE